MKNREDLRLEAEVQQREELAKHRMEGIQEIGHLMRDVRGLAEDMHEEMKAQEPMLS